jgi:hypothetical protein
MGMPVESIDQRFIIEGGCTGAKGAVPEGGLDAAANVKAPTKVCAKSIQHLLDAGQGVF